MKTFLINFFCILKEMWLFPFTEGFAINRCFGNPRRPLTHEEVEELKRLYRSEDK